MLIFKKKNSFLYSIIKMSIKKIVQKIELKNVKKEFFLAKEMMETVSEYIIKNNLILYGGYALNLILPEKKKIYKKHTYADYDCYSHNAKQHAFDLAKIFKKKKYSFIKVKIAKHENTYKLYIGRINIIDITSINKNIYNILLQIHSKELSTNYFDNYKYKYKIVPMFLLKRNFYYELARPNGSYFRWEKIHERLKLYNTVYNKKANKGKKKVLNNKKFTKIPNDIKKCKTNLLKYIKKNKTPIVGTYALKLIQNIKDNDCCRLNKYEYIFEILSNNYNRNCKDIFNIVKKYINLNNYKLIVLPKTKTSSSIDILKFRYRIQLIDKNKNFINLIEIIKVKNNCFSIQKIKNYNVGSYDTILCFLYSQYITFLIGKYINPLRKNNALNDIDYDIRYYEKLLKKVKTSDRYKIKCYGRELTREKIYEENWFKKLSLLKYK